MSISDPVLPLLQARRLRSISCPMERCPLNPTLESFYDATHVLLAASTMTSIVIAAHNEATVIGGCLDTLLADARPEEFDVTVVANGCTDATAEVAARRSYVRVVEIQVASKPAALNAGDEVAIGFPRIYLDADILVSTDGARALSHTVDGSEELSDSSKATRAMAAVPRRHLDLTGRPILVRAYYSINTRMPVFASGLFGRGMIALSGPARERFDQFPDMVADDLFLDSLFTVSEKAQVDSVTTNIATARRTRDLVRRLVRVRRGNAAMRVAGNSAALDVAVRPADRWSWLRDVVLPEPRLVPAALAYVAITGLAAILAKRTPSKGSEWGRDESSRIPASGSTEPLGPDGRIE